jgi:hypothetical protein
MKAMISKFPMRLRVLLLLNLPGTSGYGALSRTFESRFRKVLEHFPPPAESYPQYGQFCTQKDGANNSWIFTKDFMSRYKSDPWVSLMPLLETTNISTDMYTLLPQPHFQDLIQANMIYELDIIEHNSSRKHLYSFLKRPDFTQIMKTDLKKREWFMTEYLHVKNLLRDRHIAFFDGAWTDGFGLIVHPKDCRAVRNGACPHAHAFDTSSVSQAKRHRMLISFASGWSGTWHFPMESIVALANTDFSAFPDIMYHVPIRSDYIMSWMDLHGIPRDRVVDRVQYADILIVPQPAHCGEPFLSQLDWLKRKFKRFNQVKDKPIVVYISRHRRGIINEQDVKRAVHSFASLNNFNVVTHNDRASLQDQIDLFSKATMIVAPHGAAEMFINFMDPYTYVFEFILEQYPVFCYAGVANFRRLNYHMELLKGAVADITSVEATLAKMGGQIKDSLKVPLGHQHEILRNRTNNK